MRYKEELIDEFNKTNSLANERQLTFEVLIDIRDELTSVGDLLFKANRP